MTLLKRLATSFVLFVFFFVVFYFAIALIGAFVLGFVHGLSGGKDGAQIGENFVNHYAAAIALWSLLIALAGSIGLSFSGILPWCRKEATSAVKTAI